MKYLGALFLIMGFLSQSTLQAQTDTLNHPWKAGVAKVKITPTEPLWMAGYAARTRPAEGTLHDLWAKALALEDAHGYRAVLVTMDLVGIPKKISDTVRERILRQYDLLASQIILNSSHTHSGPVLENALSDIYPLDTGEQKKVADYSRQLENQLVTLVGAALQDLAPARLAAQNGVTRFQVNRRNNDAATLPQLTELKGPNDYAVPTIRVLDARGQLKAVTFGYACHATVLSDYDWSGDYPGFAQLELEKAHPGAVALFFQGAGADQNPLPRRTVPLARQYGRELAAAVERVLEEEMRPLPARLRTACSEIALPLSAPPPVAELRQIAAGKVPYESRWASRMLEKIERNESIPGTYPYPVQLWQLGGQTLVALGGEVVVKYAIEIKKILGPETFVMGYANDVMAYIPSEVILEEGGYEGATSQRVYGLPGPWLPGLESTILAEVSRLSREMGIIQNKK